MSVDELAKHVEHTFIHNQELKKENLRQRASKINIQKLQNLIDLYARNGILY